MTIKASITAADVERSYLILALLQVTEDAADYLGDQGDGDAGQKAHSIVSVLRHIRGLQGELHDAIERAELRPRGE